MFMASQRAGQGLATEQQQEALNGKRRKENRLTGLLLLVSVQAAPVPYSLSLRFQRVRSVFLLLHL